MENELDETPNTVEAQIPFSGFYNTSHSYVFDTWLESVECEVSESEYEGLCELFADSMDYKKAFTQYAKIYTEEYCELLYELSEHSFSFEFSVLVSPREYNFATDRIFVKMPFSDLEYVHCYVTNDHLAVWEEFVKSKCTSYDGFISFYPSDQRDWPNNLEDWEEPQRGLLLECFTEIVISKDDTSCQGREHPRPQEIMRKRLQPWNLLENWLCNGGPDEIVWDCVSDTFKEAYDKVMEKVA